MPARCGSLLVIVGDVKFALQIHKLIFDLVFFLMIYFGMFEKSELVTHLLFIRRFFTSNIQCVILCI